MLRRIGCAGVIMTVGLVCGVAQAQQTAAKLAPVSPLIRTVTDEKAQPISVGSDAPALVIEKWVKGQPVTGFEKGRVYAVEFWATDCAPCRKSIPHVSALQKKYKDRGLTVIGISSEDGGLAEIEPFIKKQGDKMDFTVAFDKVGMTDQAWLKASGSEGIPTAFVVDRDSKIAWIGHPMDTQFEKAIEQVLAGTFNMEQAASDARRKVEIREQSAPMMAQVGALIGTKDYNGAIAKLDEMIALDPASMTQAGYMKFNLLATHEKKYDAAYGFARQTMLNGPMKDDSRLLHAVAWTIMDSDKITKRDLPLAEQLAKRANEISNGTEPTVMDTYARALFENGKKREAIQLQTKAVGLADEAELKRELQERLDKYQGKGG